MTLILLSSCQNNLEDDNVLPDSQKECHLDITGLDFDFGMHYDHPENYMVPGDQSVLDSVTAAWIMESVGPCTQDIQYIRNLCQWFNETFEAAIDGGASIGNYYVVELCQQKKFYGCHSAALILSSILRKSGYPSIMIETASVNWAYDYKSGVVGSFIGHVMSEVFVEGKWILLDNNGKFVNDYDPHDPFISTPSYPINRLFVLAKGLDTWDYYNKTGKDTHALMTEFAENVYCFEDLFDTKDYSWSL